MSLDELLKLEPEQFRKLGRPHMDAYNEEMGIREKIMDEYNKRRRQLASQ